jgi:hypothetical protein
LNGYNGDTLKYQVSVPVNPGQSGSPLFDEQGNVIGVISAKNGSADGVSYAVKSSHMIHFFENCDVDWGDIAFYGSSGKGILTDATTMEKFGLPDGFFDNLNLQENSFLCYEKIFFRAHSQTHLTHSMRGARSVL